MRRQSLLKTIIKNSPHQTDKNTSPITEGIAKYNHYTLLPPKWINAQPHSEMNNVIKNPSPQNG
jgi:hypothetical protein